jgi:hypothetical protein
MKTFVSFFFLLLTFNLNGQLEASPYLLKLDEIKNQFPKCVVEDEQLEAGIYTALAYFPELKEISIVVKFKNIHSSMICRPTIGSLFTTSNTYFLLVNKHSENPVYPLHAPFSALVGCFGHELAHIVRYESQSKAAIVFDCFRYISNKPFRSNYENETDIITAQKGLGFENYEFEKFLSENPDIPQKYMNKKHGYYNNSKKLLEIYFKHDPDSIQFKLPLFL